MAHVKTEKLKDQCIRMLVKQINTIKVRMDEFSSLELNVKRGVKIIHLNQFWNSKSDQGEILNMTMMIRR